MPSAEEWIGSMAKGFAHTSLKPGTVFMETPYSEMLNILLQLQPSANLS